MRCVCALLLALASVTSEAADVASLGFTKVEPLLREWVFSQPQYAALKKESDAVAKFDPAAMMNTDDKGQLVFDKAQMQQATRMMSRFDIDKKVQDAMRRELVLLVDNMDLDFGMIVNADEPNAVFYSELETEDITQKVYQELVRRLSKKEPSDANQ